MAEHTSGFLSVSDSIALGSLIVSIPSVVATIIGAVISYYGFKLNLKPQFSRVRDDRHGIFYDQPRLGWPIPCLTRESSSLFS